MAMYLIIVVALAVFIAINTIRIIMVVRGRKGLAAVLAAVENFIYMSAFAYISTMPGDKTLGIIFASLGYALGVLMGSIIETKIHMGHLIVQIIADGNLPELLHELRKDNYGVTNWKVEGLMGSKDMLYILVKKRRYAGLEAKIRQLKPQALVAVYEPKYIYGGFFK